MKAGMEWIDFKPREGFARLLANLGR